MILQVLKILSTELETFLDSFTEDDATSNRVVIGNIAFHDSENYQPNSVETSLEDKIVLTVVQIQEEAILKNNPHYTKNIPNSSYDYHNPKVNVNLFVMFSCNSTFYENAMTYLSRIIRFFQSKNVFTHTNSNPNVPGINPQDQLENYKIIMDLYSPTFEQANHLWGMLGGKQLPCVVYKLRLLDLQYERITDNIGEVKEIHIVDEERGETVIVTEEDIPD